MLFSIIFYFLEMIQKVRANQARAVYRTTDSAGNYMCHLRLSGVFIVNSEHISHLALVFQLLTLNK